MADSVYEVTFRIKAENATQAAANAAKQTLNNLKADVEKQTTGIRGAFDRVNTGLQSVGISLGTIAGAGAGVALVRLGRDAAQAASTLSNLNAGTGATVQGLQRLEIAGKQVGVSLETAARGVQEIQRNLAGGDQGAVAGVARLGLAVDKLLAQKPDQMFETIARAIAKIPDPAERTRLAWEILGKSGRELLPLLTANIDKLASGVVTMSDKSVAALDRAGAAWERLKISARNTMGEILGMLMSGKDTEAGWIEGLRILDPRTRSGEELPGSVTRGKDINLLNFRSMTSPGRGALMSQEESLIEKRLRAEEIAKRAHEETIKFYVQAFEDWGKVLSRARERIFDLEGVLPMGGTSTSDFGRGLPWTPSAFDLPGGGGIGALLGMFPNAAGQVGAYRPPAGPGFGSRFGGALFGQGGAFGPGGSFVSQMGPTIIGALMGGGSVSQSLASMSGGMLGQSLQKALASGGAGSFGQSGFGKFLGANAGGLGALAGPVFGAMQAKGGAMGVAGTAGSWAMTGMAIGGPWGAAAGAVAGAVKGLIDNAKNTTKGGREDFAKSLGVKDTSALWTMLREQLPKGQADELINRALNVVGKKDEAGNQKWQQDVMKALDAAAVDKAKNSWENLQATAERFGISIDALGPKFQGAKVKDNALEWVDAFNLLVKNGGDFDAVLAGMSDEAQNVVNTALKFGVQIPAAMRPFVEILIKQGKLIGLNGEALTDMTGIKFDDSPLTAGLDKIGEYLRLLLEGLGIKIPAALDHMTDSAVKNLQRLRREIDGFERPGHGGGGGAGPIPAGAMAAGGGPTIIIQAWDGADVTRAVKDKIAPALAEAWRTSGSLREPAQEALGVPGPGPRVRTRPDALLA